MLAQVQAVVDTANALKTTSDNVVAFIKANQPVSPEDLAALTAANTTLTAVNTALTAVIQPAP